MRYQDLAKKAEDIYTYASYKKNITNLGILNSLNIIHGFNSDNYPQLPSDNFTIFLIYSVLYYE